MEKMAPDESLCVVLSGTVEGKLGFWFGDFLDACAKHVCSRW